MNKKTGWAGGLLILAVASCGGGDGTGLAGLRGGTGTGGTPGAAPGSPTNTVVHMGSTSGGDFQENVIGIAVTNLSAGGSTSLTVQLQTADGAPYTESADVTFSSDCQSAGQSEIETPVVTTTTGTATTTYTSIGCSGTDTITARSNANGQQLVATGSLNVAPASLGSIAFVSATPQAIGLKGTGAAGVPETALLKFRVANDVGGPVPDEEVLFELSTDVGGLSLAPESAISGADGIVSVTVRSGTIPTAVRVTATVADTDIGTQSSALTVSTAIPDQDSFSLSAEVLNPEAWGVDGVPVTLTVLAADRFNNLVPDGTAIVFTTELGAVVSQCLTSGGACTATWRSQTPRVDFNGGTRGRATVIAHAIGEESFEDSDGDGVFDGSLPCSTAPAGEECFYDLPEAWRDDNEDGNRDAPNEDFVDFDADEIHDAANGQWNGIVCSADGECTPDLVSVSDHVEIVMARSNADILFFTDSGVRWTGSPVLQRTITACIAGAGTFEPVNPATLAEITAGQPMPAGTTIAFSASTGEISSSKTEYTVPSTNDNDADCYTFLLKGTESGEPGTFEVLVTSPAGIETLGTASIVDSPAP